MHHYQGFTGFSQFFQNIDNGYFCGGIDPLKWFIHEINRGILYQSTRQKHPLLLTTAQLTDLPVFKGQHAYFFQCFCSLLSLFGSRTTDPSQFSISSHQYHIDHRRRKIPVYTFFLRHICHLSSLLLVWYGFPKIVTLPAIGLIIPRIDLISVDLPAPLGPTTAIRIPSGILRSTSHNTGL